MGTVFEIWNYCFLIAFILLFFRNDAEEVISDIFNMIFAPSFFLGAICSLILIYCFMPLTIPYSITNIIKKK